MAGGKRKATSRGGGYRPAKQRKVTTKSTAPATQTTATTPLSSPLKPLPKPNLRDLLTEPVTSTFKPVPSEGFSRRISTDLPQDSLLNIFRLFCPVHMLDEWAEYMNHAWKPTYAAEIYLFFGMLIYMSIHLEPRFEHYWSTAPTNPVHPIARFMSRNRFQLLYRRFCVWDTMDPPQGVFSKIHNWSNHLQETSTRYWKPASEVSVDEAMVRYTGKSTETVHIPAKPIPMGYKVWVVADSGYFLQWSFHAKGSGPVGYDASLYPELAPTQGIVIDLLSRLPAPPSTSHGYHCFMDNLFSTPELFEFLRGQGTAATGTTRLGRIDSRKMAELKTEDRSKDVVAWGTLYVRKHKTKEVMQFAFKDNALVLAMSTRFTGFEPSIWRLRRRPGKTSTSARTARVPFEGEPTKMLQIPRLIDEYNHHMNGVDNGDQLRAEFESPRRIQRGGHQALMYMFLLEVAVTNSFLLQREGWPKTSRLRCRDQTAFRLALCKELLLQYGKQVALRNSQASCIPEAIPIQNAGEIHSKVHREKRGWCACCSSKRQNHVLGRVKSQTVVRKHYVRRGCLECGVPLCDNCWNIWHSE